MIINGIVGHEEQETPDLQVKNVVPSTDTQYINPDAGYDGLKGVIVEGDSNLVPENIRNGVEIFGVTGEYSNTTITQYKLPLLAMILKPGPGMPYADNPYYFKIGEEVTKSYSSESWRKLLPPVNIGYNYYPDTIRLGTFTTVTDDSGIVNWRSDGDRVIFVNELIDKPDSGTKYFYGTYTIQRDTVEVTRTWVPDESTKQDHSPILPNGNYIVRISGWRIDADKGNVNTPVFSTTYSELYNFHNAIAVANMYVRNNGDTITFGEIVTPEVVKKAQFFFYDYFRNETTPPHTSDQWWDDDEKVMRYTTSLGFDLGAQVFDVISFTPVNE